ncbi:protein DJ-1 homolog B [Solanum lycopersicum]|uniref:protein DJ-1 homolog B n=1 Tax=Solanum lycopersicum TaxID=4081 RepID=UPI0002BCBBFE|nr:protein DJ-1 homolog B [Solanum lycopersicum]
MAAPILRHLTTPFPAFVKLNETPKIQSFFTLSTHPNSRKFSRGTSISVSAMASATKKVLVPIANGTEPIEAIVPIDILRRAGAEVIVASVGNQLQIEVMYGIKIVADVLITDCVDTEFDLISLPGGVPGAANLGNCKILESIVKKQAENGKLYAAICAAPAIALGSWGLLKGLKATCYPSYMEELSSHAIAVESRVQKDAKVVTSRGPATSIEYAVALVEELYGKEKANEVSGPLVMRPNHSEEFAFAELNSVNWTLTSKPRILVPIANGSEEMEATIIIDVLRRANAQVVVASMEDKLEIVASRKVKLVADVLLDEAAKQSYDLIVLPGGLGGAETFAKSEKLVDMLKKQRESSKPYGAMCASPALVLEPHGLLQGKKATAFPALCNKLSDPSEAENRVVVDGNLVTSRGPGTTMEFALAIADKFIGHKETLELAKEMIF